MVRDLTERPGFTGPLVQLLVAERAQPDLPDQGEAARLNDLLTAAADSELTLEEGMTARYAEDWIAAIRADRDRRDDRDEQGG